MNRKTRTIGMFVLVIAILLLASLPTAAKEPVKTDYEARLYVCELGPSAREWVTDDGTVWHFRNMFYQSPVISDEPRVNGIAYWRGSQDQNLITGDGCAWGTGIIETEVGIWHAVYSGTFSGVSVSSTTVAHGVNGLQGQVLYWEGQPLLPPYPDPYVCPDDGPMLALQVTGYILER